MADISQDTKERILDAAEVLFAERGFSGTSLRAVTSAAGVNLAAVNYHFGSKAALLHAALGRRIAPVNEQRLKWLERLQAEAPDGRAKVRDILESLLAPAVYAIPERIGRALAGRIYSEPPDVAGPLLRDLFADVAQRYLAALERSLPELPAAELAWRFTFVIGVMVQVISGTAELAPFTRALVSVDDQEATLRRMLDFAEAGMLAPAGGAAS